MGLLGSARASRSPGKIRQESLVVTIELQQSSSFDTIFAAVTAVNKCANYHEPVKTCFN